MIVNTPPDFPEEHQGKKLLALVGCASGDIDSGHAELAPLGDIGNPILAAIEPMPYAVLQTAFDAGSPTGARYYWKSQHLSELSDEILDKVVEIANDMHGDLTIIGIEQLGGACGRIDPQTSAYAHRASPFCLSIWTGWTDSSQDAANIAWTRSSFDAISQYGTGVYVNYMSDDETDRIGEAYGENFSKLLDIKKKWDPQNVFSGNQNIAV
jgi:hypothetical protein